MLITCEVYICKYLENDYRNYEIMNTIILFLYIYIYVKWEDKVEFICPLFLINRH
jgi:hypothetical protein